MTFGNWFKTARESHHHDNLVILFSFIIRGEDAGKENWVDQVGSVGNTATYSHKMASSTFARENRPPWNSTSK
jgi:hypothetical protein